MNRERIEHIAKKIDEILSLMNGMEIDEITSLATYFIANLPVTSVEVLGITEVAKTYILKNNHLSEEVDYVR